MQVFLGIDPGREGAVAWLCDSRVKLWPLPVVSGKLQIKKLASWIDGEILANRNIKVSDVFVVVEQVYVPPLGWMRKNNISPYSVAQLHRSANYVEAMCQLLDLSYQTVPAQTWKARILVGLDWRKNKKAPVEYVQHKYPHLELKRSPRCRKVWVDGADAVCIAEYGRMSNS